MEPLNKDIFRTSPFVLCRVFQRWFSIECVYMSTFSLSFVGRFVLFQSVLCWEVCPLSECPLLGGLPSFRVSFIGRFALFYWEVCPFSVSFIWGFTVIILTLKFPSTVNYPGDSACSCSYSNQNILLIVSGLWKAFTLILGISVSTQTLSVPDAGFNQTINWVHRAIKSWGVLCVH